MGLTVTSSALLPSRRGRGIAVASCLALALLVSLAASAGAVPFQQVPSPRPVGWAVDLTGTLPQETLDELDRLGDRVEAGSVGAELAVVVVGSTDGLEPREYALRLFNTWGLGNQEPDGRGPSQGVLLFTSLDDRATEIVLGRGIDRQAARRASAEILRQEMMPRLRVGDPGGALLAGARGVARQILDVPLPTAELPAVVGPPEPAPVLAHADDPYPLVYLPDAETSRGADTVAVALFAAVVAALGCGLVHLVWALRRRSRQASQPSPGWRLDGGPPSRTLSGFGGGPTSRGDVSGRW